MEKPDIDDVFSEPGYDDLAAYPDLEGRTVFVTGGGSGIGAYLTAAFAGAGARVGFISLREEPARDLCKAVEARTGNRPIAIQGDIREIDSLKAAIAEVADTLGPIAVLVNNAARDTRHTVDSLSVEEWDQSLATNLRPSFFAVQAVVEGMRREGGGSIINMGSNASHLGLVGYPAYVTAKAGILGMTKALARELGPDNIRVNALIPGWVMTARQKRLWVNEADLQACIDQQSLKSPLNGWDVAGPALFLASGASGKMAGQELIVDGGRV